MDPFSRGKIFKHLAWKWPPLGEFVCAEPARGILEAAGVHPGWLSLYTWGELCNLQRYGTRNYVLLTLERLVRRALFGLKQGFQVVRVTGTLEEAVQSPLTGQLLLAWSPEKPDVARNLALDQATRRSLVEREYENMCKRLQMINVKNMILEDLCHHRLAQYVSGAHSKTMGMTEDPPRQFLIKWVKRTGASEEDLKEFLKASSYPGLSSAVCVIPSLKLEKPPQLFVEEALEVLRTRLEESIMRFSVLVRLRGALWVLLRVEGCLTDLVAYLLDCVPSSVAPKEFTVTVLHAFGLSKKAGTFTTEIPIRVDLAKQMRQ